MTIRVAHVNCVVDAEGRDPVALLAAWWTLPTVVAATIRAGAEVTVIQASRFDAVYRQDGITYRFIATPRWRQAARAGLLPARIASAVADLAPDVVHFNGLDFPFHARAVGRVGVPMLVQDHAGGTAGLSGHLRRWGYREAAAVAFTAAVQAEPFLRRRQLRRDIAIVEIPECSSTFTPGDQTAARARTGVTGHPALLWVGHLDPNKDPLTILAAFRQVLEGLPDARLWCAFAGTTLLPEIERMLVADPRRAARVHLLGRVPHATIELLARACDFFISGSRREGSGYALIEAMACGLTPIVTDIPPFRALTGDGTIGALVPAGDAPAFAAAIVALTLQPRADQRRAVTAHFQRYLSFDVVGTALVDAYGAVISAARGR